jgi:DNA-binding NtrC family response regulator
MGTASGPRGKGIKLLLVDSEAGYAEVLAKRLARRQIEVCAASSASEAVQVLRRAVFDVAVVDLKMEDMDGLELLRLIKETDAGLPIIVLTGHGLDHAAREGVALVASDYLNKPCDLDELLGRIRKAAAKRGDTRGRGSSAPDRR